MLFLFLENATVIVNAEDDEDGYNSKGYVYSKNLTGRMSVIETIGSKQKTHKLPKSILS